MVRQGLLPISTVILLCWPSSRTSHTPTGKSTIVALLERFYDPLEGQASRRASPAGAGWIVMGRAAW